MVSAVSDLIALFDSYAGSEGFARGAAFVIVMMFLGHLFDFPFVLRDIVWQRRSSHNCKLRHSGVLKDPCNVKGCPAHGTCPYYESRERWVFFKTLFKRQK